MRMPGRSSTGAAALGAGGRATRSAVCAERLDEGPASSGALSAASEAATETAAIGTAASGAAVATLPEFPSPPIKNKPAISRTARTTSNTRACKGRMVRTLLGLDGEEGCCRRARERLQVRRRSLDCSGRGTSRPERAAYAIESHALERRLQTPRIFAGRPKAEAGRKLHSPRIRPGLASRAQQH